MDWWTPQMAGSIEGSLGSVVGLLGAGVGAAAGFLLLKGRRLVAVCECVNGVRACRKEAQMGRQDAACARRSRLARAGLVLGLAWSVVLPSLRSRMAREVSGVGAGHRAACGRARDGTLSVFTLSNGVTLLVQPVPGVSSVAIQESTRSGSSTTRRASRRGST